MPNFAMPDPASKEADSILFLWQTSWIAALAVGVVVWGLMGWAIVAYTRRRNPGYPTQTRYNMPIEILFTVLPFVMIGAFFYFIARDEAQLTKLTDDYQNKVNVVAFRWSWAFNYLDDDTYDIGVPATAGSREVTEEAVPGDLGTGPVLWLPVNEKTRFVLTSPDVIHSFYVPAFLFKMDVIPGRTNQFELTPNKIGTYAGKCAELCGLDHSRMLFNVKVVSKSDYDAHMAALKARGQTGNFDSGRISNDAEGKQGRFRFQEDFSVTGATQ